MTFDMGQVEKAYKVIKDGGLALVKGDIGYGLIGHSENSIDKMYEIKGRPSTNPCITVGNLEVLKDVAKFKEPKIIDWIREVMKEDTLAVINEINPDSKLLASLPKEVYTQSTQDGTVATFLNTGEFIENMVKLAYEDCILLVASSANLSFQGNNYAFEDIPSTIVNKVDYYLDMGTSKYQNKEKLATTIVNLTNYTFKRKGVNYEKIKNSLNNFKRRL